MLEQSRERTNQCPIHIMKPKHLLKGSQSPRVQNAVAHGFGPKPSSIASLSAMARHKSN